MFRRSDPVRPAPPDADAAAPEPMWPNSEYAMSAVSHLWLAQTSFSAFDHARDASARGRHEPAAADATPPQARRFRRRTRKQPAS